MSASPEEEPRPQRNRKNPKESNTSHMELPTPALKSILKALPGKDLYKCRTVSRKWKKAVDEIASKDDRWRKYCKKEFKKIYKTAHKNSPNLTWFEIYKSLTLWSQLKNAQMKTKLFNLAVTSEDTVDFFQIFDNKIGIQINNYIDYYEIETERKFSNRNYHEIFSKYRENEKVVAVINAYNSRLLICPKTGDFDVNIDYQESFLEVETDVKDFVLIDLKVYFVTEAGDIYVCKITEDLQDAKKNFVKQFEGNVLSLSFTNHLHILTENYDIYSLINNEFKLEISYTNGQKLFDSLCKFDFLDNVKWEEVYKFIITKHSDSEDSVGILWSISAIKQYGNILIVGMRSGILSIYELPGNINLDLLSIKPIKEIDVSEIIKMNNVDSNTAIANDMEEMRKQIVHIDIVETGNGHNIYVATRTNIVVIEFKHDHKRSSLDGELNKMRAKVQKT